jgi:hypothetical protein
MAVSLSGAGPLGWRTTIAVALAATFTAGSLTVAGPALASPPLTLTPTTTAMVTPNSTTTLGGLNVSGDTSDQLQVTVATTLGTVAVPTTTGLTLAYGNSWSGTQSVTFDGQQSAVDAALATVTLSTNSTTGTAQVTLTAMVAQAGYNFLAANQHFYEYVASPSIGWFTADAQAQAMSFAGQPGYLATIPNASVNTFVSSHIANATNVWFGARAYESIATDNTEQYATVGGVTYARVWRWTEGGTESPIAGNVISECSNQTGTCIFQNRSSFYDSWQAPAEPNNSGGSPSEAYQGEYVAVTNWGGSSGQWNDLSPTYTGQISGYVVEFGGKTNNDASLGTGFAGVITTSSNVLVAAAASVPAAPTVTAVPGDSLVDLTWSPPASNGASITSYQVSTDNGTTWAAATTTSTTTIVNGNTVTTVAATVTGLSDGTAYQVEVRAINSAGTGPASTADTVIPQVAPPGTPGQPTAVAGPGQALITVSPPTTGGTPASYLVTATDTTTPATGDQTCTVTGASGSCTVPGLTNGDSYTFTSTATNAGGTSAASVASNAVTPASLPDAPSGLSAVPADGQVSLSWSAPVSTGGSPVTGYVVWRSANSSFDDPTSVGTPTTTSFTDTGLTNGTTYYYEVAAVSTAGTGPNSTPPVPAPTPEPSTQPTPTPSTVSTSSTVPTSSQVPAPAPAPTPGSVPVPTGGSVAATPEGSGYWALSSGGQLSNHGNATDYGSENDAHLSFSVVAVNSTSTGHGYWLATSAGAVYSFGDASFYGSVPDKHSNRSIVAIARTADNCGYWLVSSNGTVFSFGDAKSFRSLEGKRFNQPIVGIVATPDGHGYWLAGADGGVFNLGDASFHGSLGTINFNRHIVGIAATPDGNGYWLVAANGGVFSFGDAHFFGSLKAGTVPIVGIIANADAGYRLITNQGTAYAFGTNP